MKVEFVYRKWKNLTIQPLFSNNSYILLSYQRYESTKQTKQINYNTGIYKTNNL